ncbi:Uncharacterised protein [Mycolicibacterium fortuitum]|uniref:Uncharacterized protein n=1 Tax=Mycolicibacterium fortuitum TaxID=1766 RepID=A0A378WCB2_MYCFO|nr:Uncharacterised protein [Mycolicibacterium fortuitum]
MDTSTVGGIPAGTARLPVARDQQETDGRQTAGSEISEPVAVLARDWA